MFQYQRQIHVYETDLMGIVHHSNYLRFCEEARVEWCRSKKIITNSTDSIFFLTVYETQVRHVSPLRFGDHLTIEMEAQLIKAKLYFQYRLKTNDKITALIKTVHCRMDKDFKVSRFDRNFINLVEKELWIETWL